MQIICATLQTDNHASTPSLSFLRARCSSWRPTNSVKALKAIHTDWYVDRVRKPVPIADIVYHRFCNASNNNKKLSRCRDIAAMAASILLDALLLPKAKTLHFSISHLFSSVEFEIIGTTIQIGFDMQVGKTPSYPVVCLWSQSTNITDIRTDRCHTRSISTACDIICSLCLWKHLYSAVGT